MRAVLFYRCALRQVCARHTYHYRMFWPSGLRFWAIFLACWATFCALGLGYLQGDWAKKPRALVPAWRWIEVVANGLPLGRGALIAIDTTLVSPIGQVCAGCRAATKNLKKKSVRVGEARHPGPSAPSPPDDTARAELVREANAQPARQRERAWNALQLQGIISGAAAPTEPGETTPRVCWKTPQPERGRMSLGFGPAARRWHSHHQFPWRGSCLPLTNRLVRARLRPRTQPCVACGGLRQQRVGSCCPWQSRRWCKRTTISQPARRKRCSFATRGKPPLPAFRRAPLR